MNDQARKLLAFVIHHYGVDVIQTPKQLQALLKDHAKGQFKPEISLFMQAVTEGLVIKLLTHQYASVQALSARAIKHLQQDCFIEEQAAHWVIDSWCIALKLARPIAIHTTPAPVAQANPSPVAAIKSPVLPPTPTVQATPVPIIQGASVLYKIMKLLSYLSLFYLLVVVPVAILSKQDKTPAGVGTQEDSARKPRTTLNWYDGDSFTIGGDSDEQMRQSAGVAAQEDSTAIGAEQTQDAILISEALGAVPATSTGTDTFGREVDIVETDAGNPIALTQITQFGVMPSGYETTLDNPDIPQYQKDLFRKVSPHRPAPDLYTPEGKPSAKLLEGVRRVKLLNKATAIYKEGNTTEAGLTPAEAYRKHHNELFDSDPNLYMDGWAYLNNKHALEDALPTAGPAPLEPLRKDPRPWIEQVLGAFVGASPNTATTRYKRDLFDIGTSGGIISDLSDKIQELGAAPSPEDASEFEKLKHQVSEQDLKATEDMPLEQRNVHLKNLLTKRADIAEMYNLAGTDALNAQAYSRGVAKDDEQAVTWFRKAAEQGNTDAQRELEKIKNQVAQKTQTTESLAQEPSQSQIASQPATQTQGVWTTDWGNDVIGLVTTEPCHVAELTNQGYVYALASSIPLARLKHNADAWKIVGDRAITVLGCWFKKDANNTGLIHAKFKRKKDDKIWEDDLNLADGSWTFKRVD